MKCVAALKKLAEIDDEGTKQRCLSAFANLSCEESIQLRLIEQKVVGIISDLADSYHESTYIYCTRALCNLACAEGGRLRVATEGGMRALLMISMVRSVDVLTKYWCVVALCNLLDVTSIDYMLTEGLVASTAKLSRNGSNDDTIHTCARIFNFLSSHAPARLRIIEKASTLHALYSMIDSSDNETRILAARTTSNLLFSAETRDKAIEAGALHTLQVGHESIDTHPFIPYLTYPIFTHNYFAGWYSFRQRRCLITLSQSIVFCMQTAAVDADHRQDIDTHGTVQIRLGVPVH